MACVRPIIALAGAGCSPALFDGLQTPDHLWHAVDWCEGEGPFDPASVAARLAKRIEGTGQSVIVAGHSLGGFIALLMAIRHPQWVRALIISNTGAHTSTHGDPQLPQRIREHWTDEAQADFLRSCFMRPPPPPIWHQLTTYLRTLPRERLLEAVIGLRGMDIRAELAQIRCPTLIAHGHFDRRRDVAAAQTLVDGIAGAALQLLPGGHTPMIDCPLDYSAAVNRFLGSLDTAQTMRRS